MVIRVENGFLSVLFTFIKYVTHICENVYYPVRRFRYQLEEYVNHKVYHESMNLGVQLEEYIRILKLTKKKVSEELDVHYTKLSRIINDRESPNVEFMYRLEAHSGKLVPAIVWWKLLIKKQEYDITKDNDTRAVEAAKVKRTVVV